MGKKNYAYVNNELLVWARSNTPFETTYDVQERLKIEASKLELWESGEELPSITEAKKLAKLYKVPFATFFLPEPPAIEPRPYTDRRTYNDTVYREMSYDLWSEISRIIGNREKMLEYDDEENEYVDLPTFKETDSVKYIADTMRDFFEIKVPYKNKSVYKNAYNFYRYILETKGIMVAQVTGVSLDEMKGISVFYDKYPIVAVNNKDYDRAKAFSLMHEVAHLVRRSSSLCLIDFDERNDDEEKLCDRIAAEILMPEEDFVSVADEMSLIYHEWSIECLNAIADKFAVSSVSVVRRLNELKKISKSEYQRIYKMLMDDFEMKREQIEAAKEGKNMIIPYYAKYLNREGCLFTKVIMSSYSRGTITYGEMCQTLNVGRAHIDKLERAVMFV